MDLILSITGFLFSVGIGNLNRPDGSYIVHHRLIPAGYPSPSPVTSSGLLYDLVRLDRRLAS